MEESKMTDLQKQRIVQMRAEGKQYKEIAEEMDLSVATVKSHYSEAVKKLRLFFARWFEF